MTGSASKVVQLNPAPESVLAYIEDMLGELGELASQNGERALATTILVAALEAARASARSRASLERP